VAAMRLVVMLGAGSQRRPLPVAVLEGLLVPIRVRRGRHCLCNDCRGVGVAGSAAWRAWVCRSVCQWVVPGGREREVANVGLLASPAVAAASA
jgi:hypothetical protein